LRYWTVALAWAVVAVALPAFAHAFLDHAFPGAGDRLHASPAKLELQFSEEIVASFSAARVIDRNDISVVAGPAVIHGRELALPLKKLSPGRYYVSWHAVSVDTHRTEGKYDFTVMP